MTNAVLSVGSNMGDRLAYLRSALDRMRLPLPARAAGMRGQHPCD